MRDKNILVNDTDTQTTNRLSCLSYIVRNLLSQNSSNIPDVEKITKKAARKFHLESAPKLADILAATPHSHRKQLEPLLRTKPVRTASGIAVVAVMCKPHRCPHIVNTGNICVYCPGGPDSSFEYSTQSYTGYEPTSMRAIRARYDPMEQAKARISELQRLGHSTDKIEFIILGGTFMSLDADYKDYFIRNLHDALSGHSSVDVEEAVRMSEHSKTRCIGLTIETRPDYCLEPHISAMLSYGCTRVEVGVQSVFEDVARDTNRGHSVKAVSESFELLKDSAYKVIAHMMPDLPNMGFERDLACFRELFFNTTFRPDGVKIYPTLVIRDTGLYELWKTGSYRNCSPDSLIDLLAKVMALVPPWVRVYRIQRDIPLSLVSSGVEKGNLRELVARRMSDLGLRCRDIRTREVGIRALSQSVGDLRPEFVRRDYVANGGWETFLAYEDSTKDTLLALLRLRKPGKRAFRKELREGTSLVRELHVYGTAIPVHYRDKSKYQHMGYGTLLMAAAERIAKKEHGAEKLAVISGVGTRHYYRRLGYVLEALSCMYFIVILSCFCFRR